MTFSTVRRLHSYVEPYFYKHLDKSQKMYYNMKMKINFKFERSIYGI